MNRKQRAQEVKEALEQGLMPSPLSVAQIEALNRLRSIKLKIWLAKRAEAITGVAFLVVVFGLPMLLAALKLDTKITVGVAMGAPMITALGVAAMRYSIKILPAPMPKSLCEEMLGLLRDIPNGEVFRAQVLAQSREFIEGELEQARQAKKQIERNQADKAAEQKQEEACRALYGIGEAD